MPSLGYKIFEVRDGTQSAGSVATYLNGLFQSPRYRLRMAGNGAITSLQDRTAANRELVRTSDGLTINDFGPGTGTVSVERIGPVSATLRADVTAPLARTVRVTVYKTVPRLDIEDTIDQGFDALQTVSFGFNLDAPLVQHEEVGAVIRAKLAPGGDYSARSQNAIYQWLTLNHFADMSAGDNSYGVTLSNTDAYFMRLGNSDFHTLDTTTPRIDVLAGGRANTVSDVANQGGDTAFRLPLRAAPARGVQSGDGDEDRARTRQPAGYRYGLGRNGRAAAGNELGARQADQHQPADLGGEARRGGHRAGHHRGASGTRPRRRRPSRRRSACRTRSSRRRGRAASKRISPARPGR